MLPPPSGDAPARPEPRWPAVLAVLAAAALHFVLPRALVFGPPWAVLSGVATLLAASYIARWNGSIAWNEQLAVAALAMLTAALVYGLGTLIYALPRHLLPAEALLRSASVLWVSNVLVFAAWYWRLDAGGPNQREVRDAHLRGAFLFPQMMVEAPGPTTATLAEEQRWRPGFVDYLFLAFNTSTAFSPTDVPVLTHWAKLMMMLQASISFTTVALLAARAINIL